MPRRLDPRTHTGLREALETAATIAVAVVWFIALRPVALGGPTSYLFVHGASMSGTLAPGDLVITMAQGGYSVGDAIVYHVPAGAGHGLLVVHRIIGADSSGYRMQGDANSYEDPWRPKNSDIVGHIVLTLPGLGRALAWLANPFILAAVWGLAAFIMGLAFLPDAHAIRRRFLNAPKPPARHGPGRRWALDGTTAFCVSAMVGLVVVTTASVVYPAWTLVTLVLGVAAALSAFIAGLFVLPDSSIPRLNGLLRAKPPMRRRAGNPTLDATAATALSLMVGLVMVSTVAVISPAHATRLRVHNENFSSQLTHCPPPPPFAGTCS